MKAVRTIVAIGIGAALFFVLGRYAAVPVFINTNLTLQYAILGFFAAVFGPIAGLLIGFIGHFLIDITSYGPWWSWIIASGVAGLIIGLFRNKIGVNSGNFGWKGLMWYVVATVVAQLISFWGVAPALDILIYKEPLEKLFYQGLVAAGGNILFGAVVGGLLLWGYSKTFAKKGSLSKE